MKNQPTFEPVRQQCASVDFCPRNAVEGSTFCDLHQHLVPAPPPQPKPPLGPSLVDGGQLLPGVLPYSCEVHGWEGDEPCLLCEEAAGTSPRARRRYYHPPAKPTQREGLLTFEHDGGYWPGNLTLVASPWKVFKPAGLMLWNVAGLYVEAAIIGNQHQLVASCGAIPAEWFTTSQNFEQVVRALKEGKEPGRGWGDWDRLYPGVMVRLLFKKPPTYREPAVPEAVKALMWGHVDQP